MQFRFEKLLQTDGWLDDVLVETDADGRITRIEQNSATPEGGAVNGLALPGFPNAHSHSFQYAMAGLAEKHPPGRSGRNDFWSWRQAMYRLALAVDPEQLERIARMLYAELLRHGYTNVAEFHYLHHDKNGRPYDNPAEMGTRLIAAASSVGIGITLLPVFYQQGGFGRPPEPDQRRFISKTGDEYRRLYEATERACKYYERAAVGIAIHSLRGVEPDAIIQVADNFPPDVPFHLHVSEQLQEVEDCLAIYGKKPVQWMLDNIALSDRFHFVHATHLDDHEIRGLAAGAVNVVLCPTTEGNLGDGIFPLRKFQTRGGRWSIGTDSHVSLNPFEELRLLDYGQRLVSHKRDTYAARAADGDSAGYAVRQAILSGRKAMKNNAGGEYFAVGEPLDACVISTEHPLIATASAENLLNTIVYCSDETMQSGTVSGGKWVVENGRHFNREEIDAGFIKAVGELKNR